MRYTKLDDDGASDRTVRCGTEGLLTGSPSKVLNNSSSASVPVAKTAPAVPVDSRKPIAREPQTGKEEAQRMLRWVEEQYNKPTRRASTTECTAARQSYLSDTRQAKKAATPAAVQEDPARWSHVRPHSPAMKSEIERFSQQMKLSDLAGTRPQRVKDKLAPTRQAKPEQASHVVVRDAKLGDDGAAPEMSRRYVEESMTPPSSEQRARSTSAWAPFHKVAADAWPLPPTDHARISGKGWRSLEEAKRMLRMLEEQYIKPRPIQRQSIAECTATRQSYLAYVRPHERFVRFVVQVDTYNGKVTYMAPCVLRA